MGSDRIRFLLTPPFASANLGYEINRKVKQKNDQKRKRVSRVD